MDMGSFEQWLGAHGRAWRTGDPEAVLKIFTPDAAYHEKPFESPMVGAEAIRRYWIEGARDGQANVEFSARPICFEDAHGWAHWRATFKRVPSGVQVELDGVLSARFDATMRCKEIREWWHRHEKEPG